MIKESRRRALVQELRMKRGYRGGKITFSLPFWVPN